VKCLDAQGLLLTDTVVLGPALAEPPQIRFQNRGRGYQTGQPSTATCRRRPLAR
jgi:hypothetical protein